MDRFTIISVLSAVRNAFDIDNKKAALLNTVFLISYMILSPVVGYLGKAILSNIDVQVTSSKTKFINGFNLQAIDTIEKW